MSVVINDVSTTVEAAPAGPQASQPAKGGQGAPEPLTLTQFQTLARQAAERKLRTLAY
jgi:hypothetical protein